MTKREPAGDPRLNVGMALYGDLTHDSRVRREARTLALAGYDVSIVCLANEGRSTDLPDNVTVVVRRPNRSAVLPGSRNAFFSARGGRLRSIVNRLRWLRAYVGNLRSWGPMAVTACGPVDIWHLHDLTALAAVVPVLDDGVPVVYDAHEIFLEAGTARRFPKPARAFLQRYERRLVSRAAAVVTVNNEVAEVLRGRCRPRRIEVLYNCPDRWMPPSTRPNLIREAAGIPGDAPVILYHGILGEFRGIEQLMGAILEPGLDDAHLVLLGPGANRDHYVEAAGEPRWQHRVHVLDPVPPASLLPWVASADVGAMPIQASTLNHYLSTPNKLFECLGAGIPVVASDFPAMRRIILDDPGGPLGTVCDPSRVEDVAAALRSILELDEASKEAMRRRCFAAAQERWNWESESATLIRLYDDLVPRSR